MRAMALVDGFGFDRLRWVERPVPRPGQGEVLVRMLAVALNRRDVDIVAGRRALALPLVPASDASGEVVALGANVTGFAVGDRVMPCFVPGWHDGTIPAGDTLPTLGGPLQGVLAEYGAFAAADLVPVPAGLSDREAACLPCAGVSAWNALFELGRIGPGQTVLVQGTGGVALFALLFARLAGARGIAISSSDERLDRARALGADHTVNYAATPDWSAAVRRAVPDGVDCVVDVGGAATLGHSLRAVRNGGTVCITGFLGGSALPLDLDIVSRKAVRLAGVRVGHRSMFVAMCRAIAAGGVRPPIDRAVPIDETRAALGHLSAGGHFGKIVIDVARGGGRT